MVYMQLDSDTVIQTENPDSWSEAKKLTKKEGERLYKEQCRQSLLKSIKPGDTVYTTLRRVSRSGMNRKISLHIVKDGEIQWITGLAAGLMGDKVDGKTGAISVGGCGMDMGFHLVYQLGCRLWPEGTSTPHGTRNGEPDTDGGYAIRQRWI